MLLCLPSFTLFPYTTLFRSDREAVRIVGDTHGTSQARLEILAQRLIDQPGGVRVLDEPARCRDGAGDAEDRKSTRLNSSHVSISYAVFCLKKKKKKYLIVI